MAADTKSWASELVGKPLGGRYVLERLIAVGGMGAVFLAQHRGLGTHVAVKILLPSLLGDAVIVQRFLLEARTAASVGRRGVVEILDLDIDESHGPYLVMELLSGRTLSQRLKEEMSLDEARHVIDKVLETLEVVHERGIIHRDIKPGNVFLADDPDFGQVVKILDFGIARVREEHDAQARLTRAGMMIGTPRFMAPEQLRREADPRTDLYAVGLVFYCCLGNQVPYPGMPQQQLLAEIMHNPPRSLRTIRAGLPSGVYDVIDRAIERDPARRFQSAREMRDAIAEACRIPSTSSFPSPIDKDAVMPATRAFDVSELLNAIPGPAPLPSPTPGMPERWPPSASHAGHAGSGVSPSSYAGHPGSGVASSHAGSGASAHAGAPASMPPPAHGAGPGAAYVPAFPLDDPFRAPRRRSRLPLVLAGLVLACVGTAALGGATAFVLGDTTRWMMAVGRCPEAARGYRSVCGDGYFVEIPAHYEEGDTTVAGMLGAWVDRDDPLDVPINVTVVRQPYRGDGASWAAAGLDAMAGRGRVIDQTSTHNGRDEAVERFAEYTGPPPYRELSRSLVHARHGWVLRCQGSTQGDFTERRAVCERILDSFRVVE